MSSSASKLNRKEELENILKVRGNTRINQKTREEVEAKDSRFVNIQNNPFFKTIFDESLSPEDKQSAVTKLLTFEGTREQNRERVKAFDLFKEFLQAEREAMATRIIEMSDVETYALLREVYDGMNGDLLNFEEDMKPLTDIIDALHELRADNQTMDAFREIKNEDKRREEIEEKNKELRSLLDAKKKKIDELKSQNIVEENNKGFFGFGSIKAESADIIARNTVEIENSLKEIEDLNAQISKNKYEASESTVKNQAAKEKLREMLDLGSEEHRDRSQKLIDSALSFVRTSKQKVGDIREHLGGMDAQIQKLDDNNDKMSMIYAILNEGVKGAEDKNKVIRETYQTPKENENLVQKMSRENTLKDMNEYIAQLENSNIDTKSTVADLTTQAIRIRNMSEANRNQIEQAKVMHTRGIAGVADRLSSVIQVVGGAAIAESNSMAAETLHTMAYNTDLISQKESMRIAAGVHERNADLERAIESLAQYGEVDRAAREITREGIVEMQKNLQELQAMSQEVAEGTKASKAVVADVTTGKKNSVNQLSEETNNPFNVF